MKNDGVEPFARTHSENIGPSIQHAQWPLYILHGYYNAPRRKAEIRADFTPILSLSLSLFLTV